MNDAEETAVTALREATRALSVGDHVAEDRHVVPEDRRPEVALEVATLLEAAVRLLSTVQLTPTPTDESDHTLRAVAQHMSAGADLARRTAARPDTDAPTTGPPQGRDLTE